MKQKLFLAVIFFIQGVFANHVFGDDFCSKLDRKIKPDPPAGSTLPRNVREISAPFPKEISGIAALNDGGYLVVGDDSHYGCVWPKGEYWRLPPDSNDAESVDVGYGPEGQELRLVLSEDHRKIIHLDIQTEKVIGENGKEFIAHWKEYFLPEDLEEKCNERGTEGLAIRWSGSVWEIAVLWEGGIIDKKKCDEKGPFKPKIAILKLIPDTWKISLLKTIELDVSTPGTNHHFRAPDLVWNKEGFIVLLGSSSKTTKHLYKYTWLQRFNLNGNRIGVPFKLEDQWGDYRDGCSSKKVENDEFKKKDCAVPFRKKGKNWEALDWASDGKNLVMGFDSKDDPIALALFPNPFE